MSDTPRVHVLTDRYATGWNGDPERIGDIEEYPFVPLREALTAEYESDVHLAPYHCPGEDCAPRLTLQSLGFFEIHAKGGLPELTVVFLDIDFPDHGESSHGWSTRDSWPGSYQRWYEDVQNAFDEIPELRHSGVYLTRGGLRIFWPLAEPISCKVADSFLSQFYDYVDTSSLPLDTSTDQWNRLFRAPFVLRDGTHQDRPIDLGDMEPLDFDPPDPLVSGAPSKLGDAAREECPRDVDTPSVGDLRPLKGQWYYDHLRAGLSLAEEGERHDTILQVVASIVAALDTNDPLIPYRMIRESVKSMQAESADEEPTDEEVWKICRWVCRVHDGTQEVAEQEERSFFEKQANAMNCAPDEVRSRLILAEKSGGSYYVWDENKRKYRKPTSKQSMLLGLLQRYCPQASGVAYRESETSGRYLLRDYGQPVDSVKLSLPADETHYDPDHEQVVEATLDLDDNLEANFDPEIDEWLRRIGSKHAEKLLDWLATFLRLDRPTCAIYIDGPPGIGKEMLSQGIARFFRSNPVPYSELTEDFQGSLAENPLIVADEKVPEDPFRERGSSVFRRIIGSGNFRINRKHVSKADLVGYPRVLITANDAEALTIKEALESDAIEAIQDRIGYIETGSEAREYLESLAEEAGVPMREYTESWVAGGGIAEHILALQKRRDVDAGDRFIVEGWESELTENLSISFGAAPLLGKFVARAIRERKQVQGLKYGDGEVLVNLDSVRQHWTNVMGESSRPPGDTPLMKALKVLSDGDRRKMPLNDQSEQRYFWEIDAQKIAKIAEEYFVTDAETIHKVVNAESGDKPSSGIPMQILDGGEDEESA